MKAVIFEKSRLGSALVLRDVEKPTPCNGEVLVQVHNTSLNALDYRPMKMGFGIPKGRIFELTLWVLLKQ